MEVVASAKRSARKINGVSVDHDHPRDTFRSALPSYRSLYRPLFGLRFGGLARDVAEFARYVTRRDVTILFR